MSTVFPKWTNQLPAMLLVGGLGSVSAIVGIVWYYFTPAYWSVGYMPTQPGTGFSHLIHAGKLGLDCRYCHTHVEESAEANVPNVATCMGCHTEGRVSEEIVVPDKVKFIREAYEKDESIPWRRVHKLPDYVRNFPHQVHLKAGVSCVSCHGVIGRMRVVHQVQPLSMSWCLDCHANPTPNLVPPDQVTNIYAVERQLAEPANGPSAPRPAWPGSPGGEALLKSLENKPLHLLPRNCGACHF